MGGTLPDRIVWTHTVSKRVPFPRLLMCLIFLTEKLKSSAVVFKDMFIELAVCEGRA